MNAAPADTTMIRIPAPARRLALACAIAAALPSIAAAQKAPTDAASGVTTASGLVYTSLREGSGPSPTAADQVKVNYRGTFLDGREFDSSYARKAPATFPLGRVIPCWTEGVQRMKVGGKAQLLCPPSIAYGERGAGGTIPPNTTLRFEVELLEINPR
jgi:FKBP-type peptidyl-prolyl cis-trans isomerase FkpA